MYRCSNQRVANECSANDSPVRLGLRHILPALLLLAYIILVVSGERQREPLTREQARQLANMDLLPATPIAIELAVDINFPVIAPTLPIALAIDFFGGERVKQSRWVTYAVFGLFVPVLWYFVGRWGIGVSVSLQK
jgi:hypothetical protein